MQRYNIIAILGHCNFISLHSICDKLSLLGCSVLPINFQKYLISRNIHKTIPTFCFKYFLHNWEFTLGVISLFAICVKKNF